MSYNGEKYFYYATLTPYMKKKSNCINEMHKCTYENPFLFSFVYAEKPQNKVAL